MKIFEYITPGARAVRGYAERLLKDIQPEQFARTPVVNGTTISINHPAFVFGHLSLYPIQLAQMADLPTIKMEVPGAYTELFKMGAICQDDPDGSIYPGMAELTSNFFSATDQLLSLLNDISLEVLERELENPARRERFGTVGAFMAYILLSHPQTHLGQVSGWRRCMGLGPA